MNIGGGEAADQLVRMMLSSGEVTLKLSGSALKNLLALTMALAKDHKTLSGKVNMARMLKETRDLRTFPMTQEQFKQFERLAKDKKILYSAIKDNDGKRQLIDVVMPETELDRANLVFERMRQTPQTLHLTRNDRAAGQRQQEQTQERQKPKRRAQEAPVRQGGQREGQNRSREDNAPQHPKNEPSRPWTGREVVIAQNRPQKEKSSGDSPSQRGSPGTRASSATSRSAGASRTMTSERPSVELRLQRYKITLTEKHKAPTKEKNKTKVRPKVR